MNLINLYIFLSDSLVVRNYLYKAKKLDVRVRTLTLTYIIQCLYHEANLKEMEIQHILPYQNWDYKTAEKIKELHRKELLSSKQYKLKKLLFSNSL